MIAWTKDNMEATIGGDFTKTLKYTLLANYLTTNKYDIKLFQEYIKKPNECLNELNEKCKSA